jgi:Xaa-Pro aminopeptidase
MNEKSEQKLAERVNNRSHRPTSEEFLTFIGSNWDDNQAGLPPVAEVAKYAAARRRLVAEAFAGSLILIEAGSLKTRSNDTDYRFHPHAAFTHLTGWASQTVPDSVLVLDARSHEASATLFFRQTAGRDTREFFSDSTIGEFWVGRRPSLEQVGALLHIATRSLSEFDDYLAEQEFAEVIRITEDGPSHEKLAEFVSELRFVKDEYEIAELRKAVAASVKGFEEVVRNLPKAAAHPRGERIVDAAFYGVARVEGNELGYDTIAASGAHACTLHWEVNDGPVREGDLLLLDAGVEVESLYTADVTRTLPVGGKFSADQRKIYDAVLKAADAVFAIAKPGVKFRQLHETAMKVIAETVSEWGFIDISAEDSLKPESQLHRRWMVHGTSHHLGLDVHDCAQARRDMYLDQELKPGMVFTIEPGLYLQPDDLLVPAELRGIGVRIEDDVLVTETGVENLTAALPRTADDVEAWMAGLLKN